MNYRTIFLLLIAIIAFTSPVLADNTSHFNLDKYSEHEGDVVTMQFNLDRDYQGVLHIKIAGVNNDYETTARLVDVHDTEFNINFITGEYQEDGRIDIGNLDDGYIKFRKETNIKELQPGEYAVSVFANGYRIAKTRITLNPNNQSKTIGPASLPRNSEKNIIPDAKTYRSISYGDTAVLIFELTGFESFFYTKDEPISNIDKFNQESKYNIRFIQNSNYETNQEEIKIRKLEIYHHSNRLYIHIPTDSLQNNNRRVYYKAIIEKDGSSEEYTSTFIIERQRIKFKNVTNRSTTAVRNKLKNFTFRTNKAVNSQINIKIINNGVLKDSKQIEVNKYRQGKFSIDMRKYNSSNFVLIKPEGFRKRIIVSLVNAETLNKSSNSSSKKTTEIDTEVSTPTPKPTEDLDTPTKQTENTKSSKKITDRDSIIPKVNIPKIPLIAGLGGIVMLLAFYIFYLAIKQS